MFAVLKAVMRSLGILALLVVTRHIACFAEALHCMQVVYQVQLENGVSVMAVLYLVYA